MTKLLESLRNRASNTGSNTNIFFDSLRRTCDSVLMSMKNTKLTLGSTERMINWINTRRIFTPYRNKEDIERKGNGLCIVQLNRL